MSGPPAEAFGPYLVYEQLGVGGMAQVHRAELQGAEGFTRQVALKRMLPHVAADLEMVKSFFREAHLASHLHHANVAQTYELGKVDDIYFIAMELIRGRNLRAILRQCAATTGQPMPVPVALNIINQICDALDYAHNLCDQAGKPFGIIHRDVSPSNILVADGGVVKLIDFGIAKASATGMQTMSGTIKGKFGYMAPEYLEGRIDARADLFAVGVIAHELLTNRPLFSTPDDMETLKRVRHMDVVPPSQRNPNVPTEVDDIVMTALARDPDKRWQHATALRTAMTTITHRLGLAIGNPEAHDWIEWAFAQARARASPASRTIMIADEDPSIVVSEEPLTSEATAIASRSTPPPGALPDGTPRHATPAPAEVHDRAVASYARHDAPTPAISRVASPSMTLAGTGPVLLPQRIGHPPRLAEPRSPPPPNPTAPASPPAMMPPGSVPPPFSPGPERARRPSRGDPVFVSSPAASASGKAAAVPPSVPVPERSSMLLTVVLVLLVAGVAGTAVYFLLPLVS